MLYTVGHQSSYEQYFRDQEAPAKLGRGPHPQWRGDGDYPGGSVFLTLDDASLACPDGWAPYGLLTTIENTYLLGSSRHLVGSAPLARLS
jgi:hypothetical protein